MKKRAVVLVGQAEKLKILVEKKEGQWVLPNDFHLRGSYRMGDAKEKVSYLYGAEPFEVEAGFEWISVTQLERLGEHDGGALLEALALYWPGMPSFIREVALPNFFYKVPENCSEVIFFGGSFNPWHLGHRTCLDLAAKALPQAHLVVVPDSNPWKKQTAPGCRYQAFRKLCDELKGTPYSIYPGFCGQNAPNPTVEWFPQVTVAPKGLLLGDDSFFALEQWRHAEQLLKVVDRIVVVPRLETIETIKRFRERFGATYPRITVDILEEHPYAGVSSSALRSGH